MPIVTPHPPPQNSHSAQSKSEGHGRPRGAAHVADVGGGHWGGQAGEDAEPDAAGPAQLRVCVGAPAGPGGGQPRAAIGGAPSAGTWRRFYVRLGDLPGSPPAPPAKTQTSPSDPSRTWPERHG